MTIDDLSAFEEASSTGLSRRTIVKGGAWSVPIIAAAVAIPTSSASVPTACVSYDPHGVYGSSGQAIFQYVGDRNPATFTVPKTGPFYDWAGSLGFGLDKVPQPNCGAASYAFYGVTWDRSAGNQSHLYKAVPDSNTKGATSIVTDLGTFGCLPIGGYQAAWGGLAVDTVGNVWAVSNTAAMNVAQVALIDPLTLACQTNDAGTYGIGPNAAKVQPGGLMGPDITFTPDGGMWGLIWDNVSSEYWMARYHFTPNMQLGVEPVFKVSGGTIGTSAWEMRFLDGLAWKGTGATYDSGMFYVAYGGPVLGDVHSLDPNTGLAARVAGKTLPDNTGSNYKLEDLASAPIISNTSAL
ncbi:hypothetical protein J2Y69_000310 [Microbacterium resistens]|uniref:Uncharacterized protein n=1 Tax=Microbacterium resistens TaxID=156977 RepID=A0ABU1S8Z3_9MICO|nr:hypothetical protein [Microbacterium resistens]MDR6865728.1 hypothetical protein [Microbacterium resistens]